MNKLISRNYIPLFLLFSRFLCLSSFSFNECIVASKKESEIVCISLDILPLDNQETTLLTPMVDQVNQCIHQVSNAFDNFLHIKNNSPAYVKRLENIQKVLEFMHDDVVEPFYRIHIECPSQTCKTMYEIVSTIHTNLYDIFNIMKKYESLRTSKAAMLLVKSFGNELAQKKDKLKDFVLTQAIPRLKSVAKCSDHHKQLQSALTDTIKNLKKLASSDNKGMIELGMMLLACLNH